MMIIGQSKRRGITLTEVVVVLALVCVVGYMLLGPRLIRRGGISKRLVCRANLMGIGTACKIYANDNNLRWPIPAFDESQIGNVDYTVRVGGGVGSVRSPNRRQPSLGGEGGARQLSVTRSFWMLVRSSSVTTRAFICPESGDVGDTTGSIESYYDFRSYKTISYGYQVPFGPTNTRANEAMGSRVPLAADKGPYIDPTVIAPAAGLRPLAPKPGRSYVASPGSWRPFNSRNHKGDGQNVLYADGHVSFVRTPAVGVDNDNIYTVALDNWSPAGIVAGESPWKRSAPPFVSTSITSRESSTDSVIFP